MFLYWHKIRKPKEYKVRHECREHWKTPVTWSYSLLLSRAVVRWNVSSRGVGPRGRHLKRYQPVGQTELECVDPHPDLLILPRSGPYTQTRPLKFAYNFARISASTGRITCQILKWWRLPEMFSYFDTSSIIFAYCILNAKYSHIK